MTSVIPVFDPRFTDACWRAYFEFLQEMGRIDQTPPRVSSWENLKARLQAAHHQLPAFEEFVVFRHAKPIGWVSLSVQSTAAEPVTGQCQFDLRPDVDAEELGDICGPHLRALMHRFRCPTAHAIAPNARTSALALAWRAKHLNRVDRYRLHRRGANVSLIQSWLAAIPRRQPDLRLVFFEVLPDAYIDDYVSLFRQFIDDMPKEREGPIPFAIDAEQVRRMEALRQDMGTHLYTCALITADQRMIAHTNGYFDGKNPQDMYQAMTGVDRRYRGRGLSRWLKAALYTKVGEDYPENESLTTDMRAVNKPILTVNAQMGYRLLSEGNEYAVIGDRLPGTSSEMGVAETNTS